MSSLRNPWSVFGLVSALVLAPLAAPGGTVTVFPTVSGPAPAVLGCNLGHFMPDSNAADWWRYTGAQAARVFLSVSDIEPVDDLAPVGDGVASQADFLSRRAALRANVSNPAQPLDPTLVNWTAFQAAYGTVATGNNRFSVNHAFPALRSMGVEILANLTASPSRFPLAGPSDWPNLWELWQHYYAQAACLAANHDVRRFGIFNEPNGWTPAISVEAWHLRLQVCADAIRAAVADINARTGKSMVSEIFAPNTANGATKYNDYAGGDYWGQYAVQNRHQGLGGVADPGWWNFNVYNYQKYSMYTEDTGTSSGYLNDYAALAGLMAADMPGETPFPLALTEYNVRTGASYDGRRETLDTPSDFVALAANSIALSRAGASQLYLFKFGQTARDTGYLVAKNGTHYGNNDTSGANNYGGITKGGEAFRLFHKAARGGRPLLDTASDAGPNVWVLASRDTAAEVVHVLVANKNTTAVSLGLNLSALGLPDGSLVTVEEVSGNGGSGGGTDQRATAGHGGAVVRQTSLASGLVSAATLPAEAVWLVSIHARVQGAPETVAASADASLGDGTQKSKTAGTGTVLPVRSDSVVNNRRVAVVRFALPSAPGPDLQRVLLSMTAGTLSNASPVQAHIYGLEDDAWTESSVTWASLTSGLRQNVAAGRQIAHNVVANPGVRTRILGQWWASGTNFAERLLDVTEFVRAQADGQASFLIVQDHRWDHTLDSTTSRTVGDRQADGLRFIAREGNRTATPGPRLLLYRSSGPAPPVIVSQPQSLTVTAGQPASFSVGATGEPLSYQWRKGGLPLAGATAATVTLPATTTSDAGSYDCAVSNPQGTTLSSAATLAVVLPVTAAPVFTPPGGAYSTLPAISLASSTSGALLRYTTDGTIPTSAYGIPYSAPFTLAGPATVKAIAYAPGYADSPVSTATYTAVTATPITAEFEKLTVAANSGSSIGIKSDTLASGGKSVLYRSTANGQYITFALPVGAPGTYGIQISAKRASDRGIMQLAVADALTGTYANIDGPKDEYAPSITFGNIPAYTVPVTFTTAGTKYLRFTVTGKNAASSDRNLSFDRLVLTPP
ncbi:MAG: hypothetical protein RJA22_1578 [Verrucomicrobiota bacterium]